MIPVAYWSFRFMMGLGVAGAAISALLLWGTRKGRRPEARWWAWLAVATPFLVVFANTAGWIFTEMGRQPWVVYGLMTVDNAVSPGVSVGEALTSFITLVAVYAVLAVVEFGLLLRVIRKGAAPFEEPPSPGAGSDDDQPLTFAY